MKRANRKRMMTWFFTLLSLYVVYCGLLYFFQTKLLFPAGMAGQAGTGLPTQATEVIEWPTGQGTTTAWFVPAEGASAEAPAPLAMFFHGNAELMDHQQGIIGLYHGLGVSVLMVEYRGYGHSDGTPSQKHIVQDSVAVLEQVLKRDDVDTKRFVLHGRSIGGGMAAQVALLSGPAAVIVESTFTSVSGMAIRYGAPPFLVTSPLNSERAFGQLSMPILIMHGKHDSIVPVNHGHALDAAAADSTLVLFDSDHNDLPRPAEALRYDHEVRDMLIEAGVLADE